jgi:hypothetical protein
MNLTFKTGIDWTKVFIAFVLLCSVFGFSVTAQTNDAKPMTDKALTALIEELKGVVARSGPDEKDAALVADRWDKRTDLKGKTKKEVINLLFQDVKAVIKDSGIQYEIGSTFSFYKNIPDESQPADTQKHTAFAQDKSVYTDLAADKCKTIDVDKGMPGNYSGRCKGVGGYDLKVYLDDERNSVGVVLPSKKTVGLDFWNYFGNFPRLEKRLSGE